MLKPDQRLETLLIQFSDLALSHANVCLTLCKQAEQLVEIQRTLESTSRGTFMVYQTMDNMMERVVKMERILEQFLSMKMAN